MISGRYHVAHGMFVRRWLDAHASMLALEVLEEAPGARHDDYFDTRDGRLRRAGLALVESRGQAGARIMVAPLSAGLPPSSIQLPPGTAFDPTGGIPVDLELFIAPLVGRRPLIRVVEVRTRTQPILLRQFGTPVARITLEESSFAAAGVEPRVLHAVAIESMQSVDAEGGGLIEAMVTGCALTPAPESAALDAMRFAGLPFEATLELGSTRVDRSMSAGEVAFAALRRQLAAAHAHESGARLGMDPEELHDFRVAIRRLRAAISLFEDLLPARVVRLLPLLKWLMRGTSEVRDLDVQLAELARWSESMEEVDRPGLGPLVANLERKRRRARERMIRLLDSRRAELLFARAAQALRKGPSSRLPLARRPVLDVAGTLITERHRKFVRRARRLSASSPAEDFHAARISAKRLRYAIEFHAEAIGETAARFTRRLASLQDLLGRHQDAVVASVRLRALLAESTRSVPGRTLFLAGVLTERNGSLARRLRRNFIRSVDSIRGKRWKDLRAALESGRSPETDHAPLSGSPWNRHRPRRPRVSPGRGAVPDAGGHEPHETGGAGTARDEGESRRDPDEPARARGGNGSDRG